MKENDLEKYPLINEELGNLLDYFSLMNDGGLTQEEFAERKAKCLHNLKTKQYTSLPSLEIKTLKFANSLRKMKCLTQDEYEIIKHRIEQLSEEERQLKQAETEELKKSAEKRVSNEALAELWEIFKIVLFILLIPLKILWWFFEIFVYGWDNVAKRDLMEDAMRRVKHDDD